MEFPKEFIEDFKDTAMESISSVHDDTMCYICSMTSSRSLNGELRWKIYRNPQSGHVTSVTPPVLHQVFACPEDQHEIYRDNIDGIYVSGFVETPRDLYRRLNENAKILRDLKRDQFKLHLIRERAARTIQRAWSHRKFIVGTYLNPYTEIGKYRIAIMTRKYGMK